VYALGVGDRLASYGRAASPLAADGGSYTYNAAGCVTRIERDGRPALDLTWNGQYQLVSVSTNGEFAESYAYDALGRRVSTTTLEGTVRHVYDDNWQCIADIDENGNVLCSYVWGEGIDKLLAVKIGGNVYYPLTDIQGTVWGYVDSQNNVVARWTYDAWGNVLSEEVAIPVLATLRYRFQGREWSAATGLINFRMRWYDAETGRWLSKDPIGLSGGMNLYVLSDGSPLNSTDPIGLAQIGVRGLAGVNTTLTLTVTGLLIPITGPLVDSNLGPYHQHIYYEDNNKKCPDVGYFDDGIHSDRIKSTPHKYGRHYDDATIRRAVDNLKKSGMWGKEGKRIGGYDVYHHNCQDFVDEVIREYFRIGGR